jgi:serine/threonine protein kinase
VKYVTCFEDVKHVYLVMEYIEFGDLSIYLNDHGTMPETTTKQVVQQVLRGIDYIHTMGISHRDLKPDNILIACEEPIKVKISDFGLAKMVNNEKTFLKTFCGTMLYLAPEVFPGYMSILMAEAQGVQGNIKRKRLPIDDAGPQRKRHRRPYNQAVDMWSLGCVVYALLCGNPPFEGKNQDEMCRLVTRGTFDEEKLLKNVGPNNQKCVDFLRQLLQVIPEFRMTEVEALRHPWLNQSSEESPGGSIEDEFRGVGYSGRGQDQVGETGDEEEEEEELERDEEEEEEEEDNLESGLPTLKAADVINNTLRGSLAQMNVSQDNPYDLCTSDAGEESDFESLINSQEGFTQGTTGLSVIDRERAHANNSDHSLRVSSDVFPQGRFDMTSVSGSSHEESDSRVSTPNTRGGPYQSGGESSSHSGSLSGAESKLNHLNFSATTFHTPPSQPNPQSKLKRNNKDDSFSFAQHFFSPESLKNNRSLMESRVDNRPGAMFPDVVSMDEDLPSTQPVNSQVPATNHFKTPPIPWGRLTPLPGSIYTEPIVLVQQLVSFGRASKCTIQTEDIRISKHHIALQIHHPNKDLQNDPRTSVVGEWKPEPGMVVSFIVLGRAGVYVGRDRYSNGSSGRLWDGDEIFLFKDFMAGGREEFIGFKVELTVGDVKRVGTASYLDRTYISAPKARDRHPVISTVGSKSSVQNQHRQTSPVA